MARKPKPSGTMRHREGDVMVTVAAMRHLNSKHFEKPEHKERVLEEAKRQAEISGYSIVVKSDVQRAMRDMKGGTKG